MVRRQLKHKRKILFVSERRADYSRLKPIMKAVMESKYLEMQLVVTGTHLLNEFGNTKKVIESDGFKINSTIPIFFENHKDDGAAMAEAMGRFLFKIPSVLSRLNPTIAFCGFDLGANFATAIAAMHMNIYVSHLQGGEVSGTIDEVIRHGLTKFAHIHFAATKQSKQRIIKLGEDPKYVFNVGSPSIDTIRTIDYPTKEIICEKYSLDPTKKLLIFLQHPVTSEIDKTTSQVMESIRALEFLRKKYNLTCLAIYSNNDAGGKKIIGALNKTKIAHVPHVVFEDFLRLMKISDVLVGNSSSGIHEAPSFGLPFVNIGNRQNLRERGQNVVDCDSKSFEIIRAVEKALFDKTFKNKLKSADNPYDNGNTSKKVVEILESIELPPIQKFITY